MKIEDCIQLNDLTLRLNAVPPRLARKFALTHDVEYFANANQSRIGGICRPVRFFRAVQA